MRGASSDVCYINANVEHRSSLWSFRRVEGARQTTLIVENFFFFPPNQCVFNNPGTQLVLHLFMLAGGLGDYTSRNEKRWWWGRAGWLGQHTSGCYGSQALTCDIQCHLSKVTVRWRCCWRRRISDFRPVHRILLHSYILIWRARFLTKITTKIHTAQPPWTSVKTKSTYS